VPFDHTGGCKPLRMIVANHKYMLLACNLKEKCVPKFNMHGAERERERERERDSHVEKDKWDV